MGVIEAKVGGNRESETPAGNKVDGKVRWQLGHVWDRGVFTPTLTVDCYCLQLGKSKVQFCLDHPFPIATMATLRLREQNHHLKSATT